VIKAKEVSRKVTNNARLTSTVDQEGNVIQKGTLVKTFTGAHKKVEMLGKTQISHTVHTERIKDQLYKLTPQKYPALHSEIPFKLLSEHV
jgi:hypothetical protein